jgi:para-nitrobenzyl esterase
MAVRAETMQGIVRGRQDGGIASFRGIPYSAPVTGAGRFRPPEPHDKWDGERDATVCGPVAPQMDALAQMFGTEPEPTDECCLYLNVYTPGIDDGRRPVLVWIHGGAFILGSGSNPGYDAAALARRGDVVVVSLNYRLGSLGFLHLADLDPGHPGTGNLGILDQVAALEWVRDNVAAFGGDPGNVTVFGESAGGMSVGTLLGTPAADGLFHKAIPQSGASHNASPRAHAAEIAEEFLRAAGVSTVDELRGISVEDLVQAQQSFVFSFFTDVERQVAAGPTMRLPFQPVVDHHVLSEVPIDRVASGAASDVPLLIGTTRDEWRLFQAMDMSDLDEDGLERRFAKMFGDAADASEVYRRAAPDQGLKDQFGAAVTDMVFRQPAIRLAEAQVAHGAPVFSYLFTWESPAMGGILGSCHALDVPFVFGNLDAAGLGLLIGDAAPQHLADVMQESWLAFACTGDPSNDLTGEWPGYDTDRRATMELNLEPRVLDDPESDRRELWTGVI